MGKVSARAVDYFDLTFVFIKKSGGRVRRRPINYNDFKGHSAKMLEAR
jgi:hypothetical protein